MEYPFITAFLIGLLSTIHCLGMCGGIMGALTFSLPQPVRENRRRLLPYLAAYNLGRIASYTLAGALLGALGERLYRLLSPHGGYLILQGIAALLMTGIGLYLAGWFPKFALIERLGVPVWRRLEPLGRRLLPVRSPLHAVAYGVIWGWLPCGLVYSTLLWTLAAGGPLPGGLFMLAFGVGTLPALLGAGMLTHWLQRLTRRRYVRQAAGLTIVALALAGLLLAGRLGPPQSLLPIQQLQCTVP